MRKKIGIYLLFIVVTILVACPISAEESFQVPASPSGWVKEGKKTFFYENGRKVTGWKKISGNLYYFTGDGLQRNTIVGSRKNGSFYVDKDGVRITDKQIKMAVNFVVSKSQSSHSSKARLKECYRALCQYPYVRIYGDHPSSSKIASYADYMLTKRGGNCYRYASSFAYIAKVLGFDVRVCVGGVSSGRAGGLSPHGWCEVKIGDTWRIVDCSVARRNKNRNLYLVTRGSYPFRLRCNNIFTMKIKDHKITWVQKKDGWYNRR